MYHYHLTHATVNTNTLLSADHILINWSQSPAAPLFLLLAVRRECGLKVSRQVDIADLVWCHRKLAVAHGCDS